MDLSYEPLMHKLIRHALRLFYLPHHCIIMDILLEKLLLKENEICASMKMLSKEFNKLIIKLKEDRLIKQESKIETTIDGRQLLMQVYYIDYREIKDIIKYKIYKMSKAINNYLKEQQRDFGYICSECNTVYSILEAHSFQKNYHFICPECEKELVENKSEIDPHELHSLMMNDLKEVIDMLKQADNFNIPPIDYFQALEMKKKKEAKSQTVRKEKVSEEPEELISSAVQPNEGIYGEITEKDGEEEYSFKGNSFEKSVDQNQIKENIEKKDVLIKVSGVLKPFKEITEEDKEKMTEEEYENYFDVFTKQN